VRAARWETTSPDGGHLVVGSARLTRNPGLDWSLAWVDSP
jgi:hypothetical protein